MGEFDDTVPKPARPTPPPPPPKRDTVRHIEVIRKNSPVITVRVFHDGRARVAMLRVDQVAMLEDPLQVGLGAHPYARFTLASGQQYFIDIDSHRKIAEAMGLL